ncbi:MAG: hypothetical protein KKE50_03000 [Nanoarchaeota archaeon]|nr:hypothetical protein [Nanoarchaeota archaeon]
MIDLYCDLEYNLKEDSANVSTNIRPELLEDFITDWVLRSQLGKGADKSQAVDREVYHVRITCDMSYDSICISADTGNKSLTCGIIARALRNGDFSQSRLEEKASPDKIAQA